MNAHENDEKLRRTALARQALWTFSLVGCLAAMPNQAWGFMTASTHGSSDLAITETEDSSSFLSDTTEAAIGEAWTKSYPPWWSDVFGLEDSSSNPFMENESSYDLSFTLPWVSPEGVNGGDFGAGLSPVLKGQQD